MTESARQLYLDLGPSAHVELLHANMQKDLGVCLANQSPEGWREKVHRKSEAVLFADSILSEPDWYVGQQPLIPFKPRRIDNVVFLSSAYVDLDIYNTEYAGRSFDEVYGAIWAAYPDLPRPAMGGSSGRGIQLIWTFAETKPKDFLPHWAQIQDTLVKALKPFGADPAATDAARVLRLSGTVNSRSNTHATICQVGEPVRYEVLQRWCSSYRKRHTTPRKKRKHTPKNSVVTFTDKRALERHYNCLRDLKTLAELRGGFTKGHRGSAVFFYGASCTWYYRDYDGIQREIDAFANQYLINPGKYHVREILRRVELQRAGKTVEWLGRQVDPRYIYRNQTAIDRLGITEDEQQHLTALISPELRKERKRKNDADRQRQKRRQAGAVEREQYLKGQHKTSEKRLQEAVALRSEGLSMKQIGDELGVSKAWVSKLLKQAREQGLTGPSPCMYQSLLK